MRVHITGSIPLSSFQVKASVTFYLLEIDIFFSKSHKSKGKTLQIVIKMVTLHISVKIKFRILICDNLCLWNVSQRLIRLWLYH